MEPSIWLKKLFMLLKSIENLHHDFEKLPHDGKALAMFKISVNLLLYIIKIAEKHFGSFQNCIFVCVETYDRLGF